jgi:ABC-type methionine transport system ATPase subunit
MIEIKQATKTYHQGMKEIHALRNISLSIARGIPRASWAFGVSRARS